MGFCHSDEVQCRHNKPKYCKYSSELGERKNTLGSGFRERRCSNQLGRTRKSRGPPQYDQLVFRMSSGKKCGNGHDNVSHMKMQDY